MAPRNLHMQSLYLAPEKAELLDELSTLTRIPKAALLREAVDDLLIKHRESYPGGAAKLAKQKKRKI